MARQTSRAIDNEQALIGAIRASQGSDLVVETTLKTDQRVIARVTDGIYRQPASAVRELISNAYDADATRVVIKTDPPRFERITIEDDGHGMSPEMLAHLLFHIGGSAKRNAEGADLGITSKQDPSRSPNGRRLIGKIGIGLFSVSQLTSTFQIITKTKGDAFRTVATIVLRQYADDEGLVDEGGNQEFESGKVNIWRERASDKDAHGTSIFLTGIRPQARDTLRSREIWSAIDHIEAQPPDEEKQSIEPPRFHIGRVDSSGDVLRGDSTHLTSLPWQREDSPATAFRNLVQCVWDEVEHSTPNPQLDRIFDYYLRMVWQLSLATPLRYVDEHLFDTKARWAGVYLLSNQARGAAERISIGSKTLRQALSLRDPADSVGTFDVFVDELKLARPLKFKNLPETNNAIKTPIIFVGKCREEFSKIPAELSGGPLAFEAYLFWTPKVAPTEHQGSLIRIHGSSGTLFDSTFMRYQVSEQTRLRQITCEIFISEGLDSALNIDRESFNNAHPHTVFITRWLHGALRQLATVQKRLASEVRQETRGRSKIATVSRIHRLARETWRRETDDPGSSPPAVELSSTGTRPRPQGEAYVYSRPAIIPETARSASSKARTKSTILEEKLKAIAQILASFDLLDAVPKRKQEALLKAIYSVLEAPDQ